MRATFPASNPAAEQALCRMIADRRDFHSHPEEGWCEFRTTARIAAELQALGFEVRLGPAVIDPANALGRSPQKAAAAEQAALAAGADPDLIQAMGGLTGCVGIWDTGRPGPVTALRFDIDALCGVTESASPEHRPTKLGFASRVSNIMHACGHDGHAAVGLGAARWIAAHADALAGRVKLLFQPAEEGVRGAAAMAASGIVDDCDWLIGAHIGCEFGPGEAGILQEGYLATTKLDVEFQGVPAHAGSDPEKSRSALVAACAAVMSIQGIPRHSAGETRISVGRLEAGEGRNVVAAHARMQLEVRGASQAANDFLEEEVFRIVRGMAAVYGVRAKVDVVGRSCRYVCDKAAIDVLLDAAKHAETAAGEPVKADVFVTERGSEDCAVLADRVRSHGGKAGFFCFGCRHQGHHLPTFDIEDEASLLVGLEIFVGALARINGKDVSPTTAPDRER